MKLVKLLFHLCVLTLAIVMIMSSTVMLFAQPTVERLQYQVENLQTQVRDMPSTLQGLDRRLTIIETTLHNLEGGSLWSQMTLGGVGLILLKEVAQALKRKERG